MSPLKLQLGINSFCPEKQQPSNKDSGNQVQSKQRLGVVLNQEQPSPQHSTAMMETHWKAVLQRRALENKLNMHQPHIHVLMKATPHMTVTNWLVETISLSVPLAWQEGRCC